MNPKKGREPKVIRIAIQAIVYAILTFAVVMSILPVYWAFNTSLKSTIEVAAAPPTFFPKNLDATVFTDLFWFRKFNLYLRNSVMAGVSTAVISVIVGTLIAYALTPRLKLGRRARENISFYVLSLRMFPPMVMVIPFFIIFRTIGLVDNVFALIITYTSFNLPFVVWVMRGFLEDIPIEYEEAAMIDGLSRLGAFIRVTLPVILPAIFTVMVFVFIFSWQEFLYALIFTDVEAPTVTIGVHGANSRYQVSWDKIGASGVIAAIPIIIFIIILRKYIVRGMTLGLVKG